MGFGPAGRRCVSSEEGTRVRGGVEHLVFVFLPPPLRLFDNTVKKRGGKKMNKGSGLP